MSLLYRNDMLLVNARTVVHARDRPKLPLNTYDVLYAVCCCMYGVALTQQVHGVLRLVPTGGAGWRQRDSRGAAGVRHRSLAAAAAAAATT